jgi:kynurenine formamidase
MITRKDIADTLKAQGTKVGKGDIVIIRTGFVPGYYKLTDPLKKMAYVAGPHTGIGPDVVGWVDEMEIAGIAADNLALEVLPNPVPEDTLSIHGSLLRDLGVYIGEIWWLEELSADCAEDGRYEFFLAAQALNIPGAVGSPLNPIAIK